MQTVIKMLVDCSTLQSEAEITQTLVSSSLQGPHIDASILAAALGEALGGGKAKSPSEPGASSAAEGPKAGLLAGLASGEAAGDGPDCDGVRGAPQLAG